MKNIVGDFISCSFFVGLMPVLLSGISKEWKSSDISLDIVYAAIVGTTEKDILDLLGEKYKEEAPIILNYCKKNFNDYLFHKDGENVFNTFLVTEALFRYFM